MVPFTLSGPFIRVVDLSALYAESAQAAASASGCAGVLAAAPLARVRPPPLQRLRALVPRRPPERGRVPELELADEEAAVAAVAASPVPARLGAPFGPAW